MELREEGTHRGRLGREQRASVPGGRRMTGRPWGHSPRRRDTSPGAGGQGRAPRDTSLCREGLPASAGRRRLWNLGADCLVSAQREDRTCRGPGEVSRVFSLCPEPQSHHRSEGGKMTSGGRPLGSDRAEAGGGRLEEAGKKVPGRRAVR